MSKGAMYKLRRSQFSPEWGLVDDERLVLKVFGVPVRSNDSAKGDAVILIRRCE